MKLSKRLETVSDLIASLDDVKIMADIGSDHGLLPAYLIKYGICEHAYASDVAKGPYEALLKTINLHHLENHITACLGNGLEPLLRYHVHYDVICICGMGAKLMVDILEEAINNISFSYLVLQANVDEDYLREYLYSKQYSIVNEEIVEDANHYYEIMIAKFGENNDFYCYEDIIFGPILRKNKNSTFDKKWNKELSIQQKILSSLPKDNPKYATLERKITLIKEVLEY